MNALLTERLQEVTDEPVKEMPKQLAIAELLRQKGELDEAMRICNEFLNGNFGDIGAIALASHILIDSGRLGLANALLKLAVKINPESSVLWSNLGLTFQEGSDLAEGEAAFIKAINRDPRNAFALNNLAQLYVNTAQPQKAINCATKAIELDPSLPEARYNLGLANLQLGNWKEGWDGYEYNLGAHRHRRERVYGKVPRWDGTKGKTVIAYGEQGLGDEISFASCIPDLLRECRVVLESDKRLDALFRRSFGVPTYGTRKEAGIGWVKEHKPDASVAFGSLPHFYRNSTESFPGTPYLKADPERRLMYRALLDSLGPQMKVGLAWTGGLKNTGKERRSVELKDLAPILAQDAIFVSLQYMDAPEVAGTKVHHWPFAVQTQDYDDTAALVAELDLVICVTTAVVDLCGGLGMPCWVLTPKAPMWRYGLSGEAYVWSNAVRLYRQTNEWIHPISEIARDLREKAAAWASR
jgi:hypothetical protein